MSFPPSSSFVWCVKQRLVAFSELLWSWWWRMLLLIQTCECSSILTFPFSHWRMIQRLRTSGKPDWCTLPNPRRLHESSKYTGTRTEIGLELRRGSLWSSFSMPITKASRKTSQKGNSLSRLCMAFGQTPQIDRCSVSPSSHNHTQLWYWSYLDVLQKRPTTPTLKKHAIGYLKDHTNSFAYTVKVLTALEKDIRDEVARLGSNPALETIIDALHVEPSV